MASASSMYLPFFVFPYQRVPGLWYMPVAVLTHTIPAVFAGGVCCFADVAAVGVVEAAGVEVTLAESAVAALDAFACGLSEPLGCADCASSIELLKTHKVTKVQATAVASDKFCTSRFIVTLLTEMRLAGAQARWNSGMMSKKADEVKMEEGQIRWPKGQAVRPVAAAPSLAASR